MHKSGPYIGIDGCPRGWVAIAIDEDGFSDSFLAPTFDALLECCTQAQVIAVDIPIGLAETGQREPDLAARSFLTGRASSVFTTPPRAALEAADYEVGCVRARELMGKAFSRQSWALRKKILEVDAHMSDSRIHEVHPEVCFQLLAEASLSYSKKTWGGQQERRILLESAGIVVPPELGDADRAGADDVLDAAVAAWTARRLAHGEARGFPEGATQQDRSGRQIVIWG